MDKGRHPHVVRTWTVERTKVPYRYGAPKPAKAQPNSRQDLFHGPEKKPHGGGTAPKHGE